jgi:hypothetical protein
MHSKSQLKFSALLRYYSHGDFARFCRAADLAYGEATTSDKYFCANLLFASQVAGLCEVSTAGGTTQWWVAHEGDIHVKSRRPKEIGVTEAWFQDNADHIQPLITDYAGAPLIVGKIGDASPPASLFDRALSDILPRFKDAEQQLCSIVPYTDEAQGIDEVFLPATGKWDPTSLHTMTGSYLVRTRGQYSGWSYFVQLAEHSIRVRITQPEWAFVVAYHLLPWSFGDLFKTKGRHLQFFRTVRLPILMCRALFAAASSVCVGPLVSFRDVQEPCLASVVAYFAEARGLQSCARP